MKKVIITLALTFFVTFGNYAQKGKKPKKHKHETEIVILKEDGKDPICGMPISKGSNQVSVYKGKQVGFCSIVCKEMFDKNPQKYSEK